MRVLIIGGAGFIGSHLADRFLHEGFTVRVLDSLEPRVHPCGLPSYLSSRAEFVHGDVTDRETLRCALRNVEVVLHQAAYQDSMPDFSRFFQVNAVGTALLYEVMVAEQLPVNKVIVASSQAVYGEGQYSCPAHGFFLAAPRSQPQLQAGDWEVHCPQCGQECRPRRLEEEYPNPYSQYAVSKLAQERAALGLGWLHEIPTVALRYSITQGPRQSLYNQYSGVCRIFCRRALTETPLIIYEDGFQTRDFVHVDDVVEANLLVLEKPEADFQVFNVGSGTPTSIQDYATLVCSLLGAKVECLIPGEYRLGDSRHSVSSIGKLQGLGWKPKRTLTDIVADYLAWIEQAGGIPEEIGDAYSEMQVVGVIRKRVTDASETRGLATQKQSRMP